MNPTRTALLSLLLLAGCTGSADPPGALDVGSAPTPRWSKVLSATSLRVAAIGDGDAVVAGTFTGPLAIGAEHLVPRGASDLFVSRVDALGRHLWTKQYAAKGSLSSIAGDATDVVLAGASETGVDLGGGALPAGPFLAKLDGSGEHVWSKVVAGSKGVRRVRTDGEGNAVALIRTEAPVDLGGGPVPSPSGAVLAKLDASGRHLWSKGYGKEVTLNDVAVTRDGDVIAAGRLRGSYDFGAGPIATANPRNPDALVVRYDPEGHLRWSRSYGTGDVSAARLVVADFAGALFVDQIDGSGDILALHKYDPRGEPLWSRELMGSLVMTTDASGDVLYATHHLTSGDTSLEMRDGDGERVWYREWGPDDSPRIEGLAVTTSGALLVAGAFQDEIDLGGGVTLRAAGRAMFVAALGE